MNALKTNLLSLLAPALLVALIFAFADCVMASRADTLNRKLIDDLSFNIPGFEAGRLYWYLPLGDYAKVLESPTGISVRIEMRGVESVVDRRTLRTYYAGVGQVMVQ